MPKNETVFTRTDWNHINVWQSPDDGWNASAVKDRPDGGLDALRFKRTEKDDAIAALAWAMAEIDGRDIWAEKVTGK